jgi:hypothetical protein
MGNKKLRVKNTTVSEKSRRHFKYRSNKCLNCGQPLDLSDVYCPYCSQLNSTKSLSLKDFITEFFSSIVSYDSRLRFTFTDLLFRPGTITKNYIYGKRLRYTNPFRFFLSVSIIYFLLINIINVFNANYNPPFLDFNDGVQSEIENKDKQEILAALDTIRGIKQVVLDTQALQNFEIVANTVPSVKDTIPSGKNTSNEGSWFINGDTIYNKKNSYPERLAALDSMGYIPGTVRKFEIFRDFYKDTEIKDATKALDSLQVEKNRTNSWIYERNKSMERISESPREFITYLFSKIPFFLFFFAPLFAIFFWLFYARRKFTYMEHLIFIFHIFSFTFLALIITALPDLIFKTEVFSSILFLLIGPVYFYLALKKFYRQSYIKTFIKFIFLNIIFFFSSVIGAFIFFSISAAMY